MTNTVQRMAAWENGELSSMETVELFSELIRLGYTTQLQGAYGRFANMLIDNGYLTPDGEINLGGREFL